LGKSGWFRWLLCVLGCCLIASPLPDELGLVLFGLINFKPKYLAVVSVVLNTLGILLLVLWGKSMVYE
jgi:hypothetical protein